MLVPRGELLVQLKRPLELESEAPAGYKFKLQVTSYRLKLQAISYKLNVTREIQATSYKPQVKSHKLQVTSHKLQITSYTLQATS